MIFFEKGQDIRAIACLDEKADTEGVPRSHQLGRVPGLDVEVHGLPEEARDGAVELSQRGNGAEEPAVPDAALGDVGRVDVACSRDNIRGERVWFVVFQASQ